MARRGDGLYLRGSVWYLDCRINGARHVVKLGKNIKRTVAGEIANIKRAAILKGEAGIGHKRKDILFEKAAEEFLSWVKTNKKPRTLQDYKQCIDHLKGSFTGKRLGQILTLDIERYKRGRVEAGARVRVNRELALLHNLLNRCKVWGLFEGENAAGSVKKVKEPQRRLRFLKPLEETQLLEHTDERLRSIVIFGINTGFRIRSEALPLCWSEVDLARGFVTVTAAYAKNGKTRSVPLNSRAREVLERLREQSIGEYVFSKSNGRPYKSMDKPFAAACKLAKLSGVTLHTLRHSFASRLAMAGVDLRTIMELGGWNDLSMVQRYSHLSPNHKRDAIEKIVQEFPNAIHNAALSAV